MDYISFTSPAYTLSQLLFTFGLFASKVLIGMPAASATLWHVSPASITWVTSQSWPVSPRHIIYDDEFKCFSNVEMSYLSDKQIITTGVNGSIVDCR